jgi:hypothetical protein
LNKPPLARDETEHPRAVEMIIPGINAGRVIFLNSWGVFIDNYTINGW